MHPTICEELGAHQHPEEADFEEEGCPPERKVGRDLWEAYTDGVEVEAGVSQNLGDAIAWLPVSGDEVIVGLMHVRTGIHLNKRCARE